VTDERSPLRLLLVEDNPGDARLFQEALREIDPCPFDLVWVKRMDEAEKALENGAFDAILLDLSLPDTQGLETVARTQEVAPSVPIVVLTGLDDEEVALEAVRRGAQDYLQKGEVPAPAMVRIVRYAIERKRAEEERRRLLKREQEARRQAEAASEEARRATRQRDEVLGMVTHDLRSPLTGIVLGATAALRRGALDEETARMVNAIRREAERMSRLLQDLLDVATIEAGRFAIRSRACDVAEVIEEATELFQPSAEEGGVVLETEVPAELPGIRVDRDRISQVLGNLLSNAIKFTPREGCVTVRARLQGAAVRVSVADTGTGIPPDHQEGLFDRFWQPAPDRKRAGAGLGLAIARGIVEAHGGEIWVESEEGKGSTFHFTVPTVEDPAAGT
jgi:phosphoserine phosphatase RsbU/P